MNNLLSTMVFEETSCWCGSNGADDIVMAKRDRYLNRLETVFCPKCSTLRFSRYFNKQSQEDFYKYHYQTLYGRKDVADSKSKAKNTCDYVLDFIPLLIGKDASEITLLEVGGGSKALSELLSEKLQRVTVLEPSSEIDHCLSTGRGNLTFHNCPLEDAERRLNEMYDLILLVHVFEHLSDPIESLELLKRLLKPNGKIVLFLPDFWEVMQSDQSRPSSRLLGYLHIAHKWNFSDYSLTLLSRMCNLSISRLALKKRGEIVESVFALATNTKGASSIESWVKPINYRNIHDARILLNRQTRSIMLSKLTAGPKLLLKSFLRTGAQLILKREYTSNS